MKRNDFILFGIVLFIGLASYIGMKIYENNTNLEDGTAVVYYFDNPVLEIELTDGSYTILDDESVISIDEENFTYTVKGYPYNSTTQNVVVIEYKDHRIRVIDEVSPQHICRKQGWSSSPLSPITCLPNNLVIVIQSDFKDPDAPDDITG